MKVSLVLCACLILAASSAVDGVAISASVVSAAAAVVSAGTSLARTTLSALMNTGYRVNCGIEVENWTRFPLIRPEVTLQAGALSTPPTSILPGRKEAMVGRMKSLSVDGSQGTVSWMVKGQRRRIVVTWFVPYTYLFFDVNTLAIGISKYGHVRHRKRWFRQMYKGNRATGLGFKRAKFRDHVKTIIYRDRKIEVAAIMGTTEKAKVKIIVRPVHKRDFADTIRNVLKG